MTIFGNFLILTELSLYWLNGYFPVIMAYFDFKSIYLWANSFLVLYKPRFRFFTISFGFWGWGSFWALPQTYRDLHKPDKHKPATTAWSLVYQIERGEVIISLYAMGLSTVPACVPACQECASVPEGHPRSVWASQRSQRVPDVLKAMTLCHCARWLKTHKTVLMA